MHDLEIKERGFSDDGEDIKMFTVEVYKKDKRSKKGKRLIQGETPSSLWQNRGWPTFVNYENRLWGCLSTSAAILTF